MTKLSVNVNKIATLRNTRSNGIPDLVRLSRIAIDAGSRGITVHPRPDQRHIRFDDVDAIAALLAAHPGVEYNIEGNPFHGLVEHCERVHPAQATLVPDTRDAFTSNQGWDLEGLSAPDRDALTAAIRRLHGAGCRVSLFVDPVPAMMPLARQLGADRIELYTEPYAQAAEAGNAEPSLARFASAAQAASQAGLGVNAGHDLSLKNLGAFLDRVRPVHEVSIGHALIADALEFGLADTVRRYTAITARSATSDAE